MISWLKEDLQPCSQAFHQNVQRMRSATCHMVNSFFATSHLPWVTLPSPTPPLPPLPAASKPPLFDSPKDELMDCRWAVLATGLTRGGIRRRLGAAVNPTNPSSATPPGSQLPAASRRTR